MPHKIKIFNMIKQNLLFYYYNILLLLLIYYIEITSYIFATYAVKNCLGGVSKSKWLASSVKDYNSFLTSKYDM